jgi:predicted DNA-binding transcriptional regulator AlpA
MPNYNAPEFHVCRYRSATAAAKYCGLGRSTFYRLRAQDPSFPKPVNIFGKVDRYDVHDLDCYVAHRKLKQIPVVENAMSTGRRTDETPKIPAHAVGTRGRFPSWPRP